MTELREDDLRRRGQPFVYAHRGRPGPGIENTLEAFDEVSKLGVDGVECDVRPCATGEMVLCHDPQLDRITDGRHTGRVGAMRWSALVGLDLGHGRRIAKLDDLLDLCRARDLIAHVEIKRDDVDRRASTLATLRALRRSPARVVVSSFDPQIVRWVRSADPSLLVAQLVPPRWYRPLLTTSAALLPSCLLHPEGGLLTPRLTPWLRRRFVVNAWTVNAEEDLRRLIGLGVDGIITDFPERALKLLGRALSEAIADPRPRGEGLVALESGPRAGDREPIG